MYLLKKLQQAYIRQYPEDLHNVTAIPNLQSVHPDKFQPQKQHPYIKLILDLEVDQTQTTWVTLARPFFIEVTYRF